MSLFLKDLVHDLREKRLWPVAAVLLLAIVAVPAVLLRSSSDEPAPAVPPPGAGAAAGAEPARVALATDEEPPASALEAFSEKDPFEARGPAAPAPPPAQQGGSGLPAGSGASATPAEPGTTTSPGTPESPAPAGDAAPRQGETPASEPGQSEPVLYTYEVDVSFGRRGRERTRRGVGRMEPLPDADRPLLVFLGTSASGRSAVFLVDQSLEQRGEGICEPNRSNCSLLYLREDADHDLHFFTDTEGRGYALRLLDIDVVPVEQAAQEREQRADDARRSRTKRDDHLTRWPFDVSPFADLAG